MAGPLSLPCSAWLVVSSMAAVASAGQHRRPVPPSCQATLNHACGGNYTVQSCDTCAGAHQSVLRAAGCESSDVTAFCSNAAQRTPVLISIGRKLSTTAQTFLAHGWVRLAYCQHASTSG